MLQQLYSLVFVHKFNVFKHMKNVQNSEWKLVMPSWQYLLEWDMSSSTIIDSNLHCKAHFNEINNKVVEHHFKVCWDKDEGFDSLLPPKLLENYNKGTMTLLKSIRKLPMKFYHIEIYKLYFIIMITCQNCCINSSRLDFYLDYEPQPTSTKNLIHFSQSKSSKKWHFFKKFRLLSLNIIGLD
jgi:hypothetical protein